MSRSYTCYITLKAMREMPKTTLDWGIPSENDRGMASQRGIMKLEGVLEVRALDDMKRVTTN